MPFSKSPRCWALCLVTFWLSAPVQAQNSSGVELRRVSEGVYAVLAEDGAGNGAVIIGKTEILVVDTQVVPLIAEEVIRLVRGVSDLPVTRVVNTHWHIDHTHGNVAYREAYGDRVEFLAHGSVADEMTKGAAEQLGYWPAFYGQSLDGLERMIGAGYTAEGTKLDDETLEAMRGQLRQKRRFHEQMQRPPTLVLPDRAIRGDTLLVVGDTQVQVRYVPGHTLGALAVYLPEARVLVAGDLVLSHIFVRDATPRQFLRSLALLESLDIATVIPGHGELLSGTAAIRDRREALAAIIKYVEGAVQEGLDADQIVTAIDREALGQLVPQLDAVVREAHKNTRQ